MVRQMAAVWHYVKARKEGRGAYVGLTQGKVGMVRQMAALWHHVKAKGEGGI